MNPEGMNLRMVNNKILHVRHDNEAAFPSSGNGRSLRAFSCSIGEIKQKGLTTYIVSPSEIWLPETDLNRQPSD